MVISRAKENPLVKKLRLTKIINFWYFLNSKINKPKKPFFPELIPPIKINYNWPRDYKSSINYQDKYNRLYLNLISDLISKSPIKEIKSGMMKPNILDMGCGFGPFAIATKVVNESCQSLTDKELNKDNINYVGIDIRKDAINWLSNAYKEEKSFYFHLHKTSEKFDYISKNFKDFNTKTTLDSDGSECNYQLEFEFESHIQWSGSFFTHLTPKGALSALKFIRKSLHINGLTANTWLIIDAQSQVAMNSGEADRNLTIDCGDLLTFKKDNPLGVTAYKMQYIEKIYDLADLKIIDILYGSWRGFGIKNPHTYQDIILAVPK